MDSADDMNKYAAHIDDMRMICEHWNGKNDDLYIGKNLLPAFAWLQYHVLSRPMITTTLQD